MGRHPAKKNYSISVKYCFSVGVENKTRSLFFNFRVAIKEVSTKDSCLSGAEKIDQQRINACQPSFPKGLVVLAGWRTEKEKEEK